MEGVSELLKHITFYAERCTKDANETTLLLRKFSTTLISDKTLFEGDKVMLEKLKTESQEIFGEKVATLAKMNSSAGAYKEAIQAAMVKIEEMQKEVL